MVARILVLEPDLLFSSSIEGLGRRFGLDMRNVATMDELRQELELSVPRMVVVDLDSLKSALSPLTTLVQGRCRLVGYYSHVDSNLAKEALASGFERVMPRRWLAEGLPAIFSALELR